MNLELSIGRRWVYVQYVHRYSFALSLSRITTVVQFIRSNVWSGVDTKHQSSTCMHAVRISRVMLYVAIVNFGGFKNLK